MAIEWCDSCRRIKWSNHRCPPRFEVWPVWNEDPMAEVCEDVDVVDVESAAERYRERDPDAWEAGDDVTLAVRAPDGTVTVREVRREMVPEYSAIEVKAAGVVS